MNAFDRLVYRQDILPVILFTQFITSSAQTSKTESAHYVS